MGYYYTVSYYACFSLLGPILGVPPTENRGNNLPLLSDVPDINHLEQQVPGCKPYTKRYLLSVPDRDSKLDRDLVIMNSCPLSRKEEVSGFYNYLPDPYSNTVQPIDLGKLITRLRITCMSQYKRGNRNTIKDWLLVVTPTEYNGSPAYELAPVSIPRDAFGDWKPYP